MRRATALLAIAACGPGVEPVGDDVGVAADAAPPDAPGASIDGKVYVHSYQNLYAVDSRTLELALVGAFGWPEDTGVDMMTDIAVDQDGGIVGISFDKVYRVEPLTAEATYLSTLQGQSFNGLSFLPAGTLEPDAEVLVGTGLAGEVWRIDPMTGEATLIGDFGGAVESSGDLVSVAGLGTLATVKNGSEADYLARIDEATGAAQIIGPISYPDVWGIGFWGDKAFGFVATNEIVLIDVTTGAATFLADGPENWTGAGVTTRAPVLE